MQVAAGGPAPVRAVVVAVDRSRTSRAALSWAAGYASMTGAPLHAVHVHHHDIGAPTPRISGSARTREEELVEVEVGQLVTATLGESVALSESVVLTFLHGFTGREVVRFAEQASLLVVGTGEHRGAERILVSSVSHYCLSHAPCPVLAVPAPAAERLRLDPVRAPAESVPL